MLKINYKNVNCMPYEIMLASEKLKGTENERHEITLE